MSDQIEWLRTQIQDRKAKAEAAEQGPWRIHSRHRNVVMGTDLIDSVGVAGDREDTPPLFTGQTSNRGQRSYKDAEHIVANDPRDTIARCDTDLAILDMAEREIAAAPERSWDWDSADEVSRASTLEDVVRLLAQGYRHRPGYPFKDAAV